MGQDEEKIMKNWYKNSSKNWEHKMFLMVNISSYLFLLLGQTFNSSATSTHAHW